MSNVNPSVKPFIKPSIHWAARVMLAGGVVAYPTEGVFGLGCMPDDDEAVLRLLDIKQRPAHKGLILIGADSNMFEGWVTPEALAQLPAPDPQKPVTWIATPTATVSYLLRGKHAGLAIRVTTNPTAAALCRAVDSPIVSTSANLSGRPVARNRYALRRQLGTLVDSVVPGECGPASGASEIRVLGTGTVLRPSGT